MTDMKFEDALKKLEKIVAELERGDLALDASMTKYGDGIKLAAVCQKKLEVARKKVEILVKTKDGKVKLEPFGPDAVEAKKIKKNDDRSLF